MCSLVGIGSQQARLAVYIANRPPLPEFTGLNDFRPMVSGEIKCIADLTGNHWRKIFNCYAKLSFLLDSNNYSSWQELRDNQLLQSNGNEQLLFSPPDINESRIIKIICGRTYFKDLNLNISVDWVDSYFGLNFESKLIVTPYFDYRQLTNQRIEQLVDYIKMG
ncbi:DUF6942 family protein [Aliikangiella coralliicola]|uniref:Uncharacterized protein n=1 Tax=Aliikangiella coralliicola TaxID=2592383 RepID=A0A545UI32_9GAMM|nr:hypothetical protein [Aliikangiella coralliicola]TQV89125.1 hypothetical protein FLL46_03080 [Aliikangiella coralliicola]